MEGHQPPPTRPPGAGSPLWLQPLCGSSLWGGPHPFPGRGEAALLVSTHGPDVWIQPVRNCERAPWGPQRGRCQVHLGVLSLWSTSLTHGCMEPPLNQAIPAVTCKCAGWPSCRRGKGVHSAEEAFILTFLLGTGLRVLTFTLIPAETRRGCRCCPGSSWSV